MIENFKTLISILMDRDFDPDLICEVIIYPLSKNNCSTIIKELIVMALKSYNQNDFKTKFLNYQN